MRENQKMELTIMSTNWTRKGKACVSICGILVSHNNELLVKAKGMNQKVNEAKHDIIQTTSTHIQGVFKKLMKNCMI